MTKATQAFFLVLAATLGGLLLASPAVAGPPNTIASPIVQFGEPSNLGVIVSAAGASTTNASTAAPFTLTPKKYLGIRYVCNAAGNLAVGATCSTTLGNAAYGQPVANGVAGTMVLRDSTTTLAICGAGAISCQIWALY